MSNKSIDRFPHSYIIIAQVKRNAQLARAFGSTTRSCMVVRKIITILHPVTPKHVGTNSSKINSAGISMLKQDVARDTQRHWSLVAEGSNAHRIEVLLSNFCIGNELFGAVCGNTREIWHEIHVFRTTYHEDTHSFSPVSPNQIYAMHRHQLLVHTCKNTGQEGWDYSHLHDSYSHNFIAWSMYIYYIPIEYS